MSLPGNPIDVRFGDEKAGFYLAYVFGRGALRVDVWGYWEASVGETFTRETARAIRDTGRPLSLTMNATGLKPQGGEGQEALRAFIRLLASVN
jgi:hypothetical protein